MSGWVYPPAPHRGGLSLPLQEEEEEDIDNLVEIHRQRVARGSVRSGTSSVRPLGLAVPCSTAGTGWRKAVPAGWVGGRQGRQLLERRDKSLVCRRFFS